MNKDSIANQTKKPAPRRSNRCILSAFAKGAATLTKEHRRRVGRVFVNSNTGDIGAGNQAQRNARAAGFMAMRTVNSPSPRRSIFAPYGW